MSELLTVALVCASLVSAAECSRDNALDVIVTPAQSPMQCLMQGQTILAQTGIASAPDVYVKISCERRRVAAAQLGRRD
jgi:hypothetical protein